MILIEIWSMHLQSIYIDEWHDESLSFGIKKSQDLLVNIAQHIAQHIPQLNDIGRKKKFALGSQLTNLIFTSEIWLFEGSFCFFMTGFVRPNNSSNIKHLVVFYLKAYAWQPGRRPKGGYVGPTFASLGPISALCWPICSPMLAVCSPMLAVRRMLPQGGPMWALCWPYVRLG